MIYQPSPDVNKVVLSFTLSPIQRLRWRLPKMLRHLHSVRFTTEKAPDFCQRVHLHGDRLTLERVALILREFGVHNVEMAMSHRFESWVPPA